MMIPAPRQCIICGKLATLECLECNGEHGCGGGLLDSTAFCDSCLTPVHNHHKRRSHQPTQLRVPKEYLQHA